MSNLYEPYNTGLWYSEGDTVVFRNPPRPDARYKQEALESALASVEADRSKYATEEAWVKAMAHFERGLAVLKFQ